MFIVKTRVIYTIRNINSYSNRNFDKNIKIQFLSDKQLSIFSGARQYDCIHAVLSLRNDCELMIADELPEFLCYLVELGHTIDTIFHKCILLIKNK